jgi:hypothetical protein
VSVEDKEKMFRQSPPWMPLVGVLIGVLTPLARGGTITATLEGVPLYRSVEVSLDGGSSYITSAWTGESNWLRTGGDDPGPPTGSFRTFCIEISQDVALGGSYTYQHVAMESVPELTPAMTDAIRELWGRHHAQAIDSDTSAAFQLAVWEIVSDTGKRLDDGMFRVRYPGNTAPSYYSTAQSWLDSVDGTGPRGSVSALIDPLVQDQITSSPLPSAAWAGIALLALVVGYKIYRWRASA